MEVSPYQRADKIFVTNQALKRLEPKSVRSVKRHEHNLFGVDDCFPSQRGLQGRWEGSAGSVGGWLGTKMPSYAAFPKVHFCGIYKVRRKYWMQRFLSFVFVLARLIKNVIDPDRTALG